MEVAVSVAADLFLKVVGDAVGKTMKYREILERMQNRVNGGMARYVNRIEELNSRFDLPNEEVAGLIKLLTDGRAIVKKCSDKVKWWNCCFKRPKYAGELLKLEKEGWDGDAGPDR